MGVVLFKSSVEFFVPPTPGGTRIMSAIDQCAKALECDVVVTSGKDGAHSGPDDPHHHGNAFDVRSHDFSQEQKDRVLAQVMNYLGWERFYGFLENPGQDTEHFHIQVKKGVPYP